MQYVTSTLQERKTMTTCKEKMLRHYHRSEEPKET